MKSKSTEFLEHLRGLKSDRGAMAALRRSLSFAPGELGDVRSYSYVEPFAQGESERRRRMYYLVAGLFALHPEEDEQTLPEALAALAAAESLSSSLELRFRALLDSDDDQLPDRLRRLVTYLRSKNLGLNYQRLLDDLLWWDHPDKRVQRRWARAFYGGAKLAGAPPLATGTEVEA